MSVIRMTVSVLQSIDITSRNLMLITVSAYHRVEGASRVDI